MPRLIKDGQVVDDSWQVVEEDAGCENLAGRQCILPLKAWLALDDGQRRGGDTAPWIDSEEEFEDHVDALLEAPLIALKFPTFMDGRGFSNAALLRNRYGYRGELRAIGYLIQDQLFYLRRCGFDSVQLREGTDLEAAAAALQPFSVTYQTSADTEEPLFRRR